LGSPSKAAGTAITSHMFKAIGTILILYAITQMMSTSFSAFENAVTATFETVEVAADLSKTQLIEAQQ